MPTTSLQPGSTDTVAVKQLQTWLVSQGYLTQAQMNTGAGTYGPQTTAAVLKYQQATGVDNSSGPGYWGPKTIAAAQGTSGAGQPLTGQPSTAQIPTATTMTPEQKTRYDQLVAAGAPPAVAQSAVAQIAPAATTSTAGTASSPTSTGISSSQQQPGMLRPPGGGMEYANPDFGTIYGGVTAEQAAALKKYGISAADWNTDKSQGGQIGATWLSSAMKSTTSDTTKPTTPVDTTKPTTPVTTTGQGIAYDSSWAARGITQDVWNSFNATQQATVAATLTAGASLASYSHSLSMSEALANAKTDPTILAKYADMAGIDKLAFSQSLDQIRQATSTDAQTKQMQFEADRKALADQSAAAGQAYSGFRGKAEANLSTTESGIVTSSRSALQKQINDATTAFEQKYGTSATTPASSQFVNPFTSADTSISGLSQTPITNPESLVGATAGNITGTAPTAQAADFLSLAGTNVAASPMTPTKP